MFMCCESEDYESISHVLWESLRNNSMCKLQELLGNRFECLESLGSFEKASFVSGSELWEDNFSPPLDLVQGYKGYIVDVWELRKAKLYLRTLHIS